MASEYENRKQEHIRQIFSKVKERNHRHSFLLQAKLLDTVNLHVFNTYCNEIQNCNSKADFVSLILIRFLYLPVTAKIARSQVLLTLFVLVLL